MRKSAFRDLYSSRLSLVFAVDCSEGQENTGTVKNQRGALLIGLIITITIIALAGAAIVSFTTTSIFGELYANRQGRAYYLAESGGRYAIPRIKADPAQAVIDLHGKTFTFDNGDIFTLSIDNTDPSFTLLESEGICQAGDWLEVNAKVTYKIPKAFTFKYGAFSDTGRLTVDNRAYIDSYDSSSGPWSSRGVMRNGHVGTNRTGVGSVDLRRNSTVYGNATVGVGGDTAMDIRVAMSATLTGTRGALLTDVDMTPKAMPAGGGAPVDLILQGTNTRTFTEGVYRLNQVVIRGDAVLTISGNVTLYIEDIIRIRDRGRIDIQAGGSLTIYAAADMVVEMDAKINETLEPGRLVIYGTSTFTNLRVRDNALIHAAVYAPGGAATLEDEVVFFGSVMADQVTINNNAALHYDEALGRVGIASAGGGTIQYF